MKPRLCLPLILGSFLSGGICDGEQVLLSKPLEVQLTYEGGTKVSLKENALGKLGIVVLTVGKETWAVPPGELEDIFYPILSKVLLTGPTGMKAEEGNAEIKLEFDSRPYEWGSATRTVEFFFEGGKYSHRWVSIPTGRNTWTMREKKAGQPETDFSSGGSLPGIPTGDAEEKGEK